MSKNKQIDNIIYNNIDFQIKFDETTIIEIKNNYQKTQVGKNMNTISNRILKYINSARLLNSNKYICDKSIEEGDEKEPDVFDELTNMIIVPKYQYTLQTLLSSWNKDTEIMNITAKIIELNKHHVKLKCCLYKYGHIAYINSANEPYIWFILDSSSSASKCIVHKERDYIYYITDVRANFLHNDDGTDLSKESSIKSYDNLINKLTIIRNDIEFTNTILIPNLYDSFINCDVGTFYSVDFGDKEW